MLLPSSELPLDSSFISLINSKTFSHYYTVIKQLSQTKHSRILLCQTKYSDEYVVIKRVNLKKIPEFNFHIMHLHRLHFHFHHRYAHQFIRAESALLRHLQGCSHIVRYISQRTSSDPEHLELALEYASDGSLLNLVWSIRFHSSLHSWSDFLSFFLQTRLIKLI